MFVPAVFSGAGLSGAPPASMPLGYALRDSVLGLMHERTRAYAPHLVDEAGLAALRVPARKLEQVLGRLWRLVGDQAMECIYCLQPALPNEAHMLAALHLARGGTHMTLNFDRGVEDAYDLISSRRELGHGEEAIFGPALSEWRRAVPGHLSPLKTVTTRVEFDGWLAAGRPPALLKPHGSLGVGPLRLLDVVVEDTEQLGGLYPARLSAVQALWPASTRPLIVAALHWAAKRCGRASELTGNGNRRALTTSHRLLALGLAAYLSRSMPDPKWDTQLRSLADRYRNAGDLAGAGNCTAARAVLAAAAGDLARTQHLLREAASHYTEGRASGELIPSGAALLERLERLFALLEPPGRTNRSAVATSGVITEPQRRLRRAAGCNERESRDRPL